MKVIIFETNECMELSHVVDGHDILPMIIANVEEVSRACVVEHDTQTLRCSWPTFLTLKFVIPRIADIVVEMCGCRDEGDERGACLAHDVIESHLDEARAMAAYAIACSGCAHGLPKRSEAPDA